MGHRLDPLRSELAFDDAGLWEAAVRRLLAEHRFQETAPAAEVDSDLTVLRGRFYDTMVWQSSALAEFGYGPDDDFRDDPAVESVQGPARVILDRRLDRDCLSDGERGSLLAAMDAGDGPVVLFFRGKDLSGTGGTWRVFMREQLRPDDVLRMLGTEALTSLVLTATLVYLDLAPQLSFRTLNYR